LIITRSCRHPTTTTITTTTTRGRAVMPSVSQGVITALHQVKLCCVEDHHRERVPPLHLHLKWGKGEGEQQATYSQGHSIIDTQANGIYMEEQAGPALRGAWDQSGKEVHAGSRHQTLRLQSVVFHHFPCRARLYPAKGRFVLGCPGVRSGGRKSRRQYTHNTRWEGEEGESQQ
jgi:hypothetical protein